MISETRHLNGRCVESADVDNATATATVPGVAASRTFVAGITADYSAAPAAGFKLITIKVAGNNRKQIRWDPTKEMPFRYNLGVEIHGDYGEQVSADLAASGTPAVTGRISIEVFTQ